MYYNNSLSKRDRAWLKQACKLAQVSTCNQRHATIIVKGGSVIAVGVNTNRNHPDIVENPKREAAFHSEINALKQGTDFAGAVAYNSRLFSNGSSGLAAPCYNCTIMLLSAGIKRVVYTDGTKSFGKNLFSRQMQQADSILERNGLFAPFTTNEKVWAI